MGWDIAGRQTVKVGWGGEEKTGVALGVSDSAELGLGARQGLQLRQEVQAKDWDGTRMGLRMGREKGKDSERHRDIKDIKGTGLQVALRAGVAIITWPLGQKRRIRLGVKFVSVGNAAGRVMLRTTRSREHRVHGPSLLFELEFVYSQTQIVSMLMGR